MCAVISFKTFIVCLSNRVNRCSNCPGILFHILQNALQISNTAMRHYAAISSCCSIEWLALGWGSRFKRLNWSEIDCNFNSNLATQDEMTSGKENRWFTGCCSVVQRCDIVGFFKCCKYKKCEHFHFYVSEARIFGYDWHTLSVNDILGQLNILSTDQTTVSSLLGLYTLRWSATIGRPLQPEPPVQCWIGTA